MWTLLIPVGIIIFFLLKNTDDNPHYTDEIEEFWKKRHHFFRSSATSPFVQKGVPYKEVEFFIPNPSYRVKGKLERFTKRETIVLENSNGTTTSYLKYGYIHFKVKQQKCSLLVFKTLNFGNQFLLTFGDATSGDTTYGGGRYLDISIKKSNEVILDFNKSYNPYCAYITGFICPFPPIENLLGVSILAGEKKYPY